MSKVKDFIKKLDIVSVIGEVVNLKKAGNNMKGLCPFHNEDTPSFVVSPDKKIFKCFGCGASGDALSFHMKHTKMGFVDSVNYLADKYSLEVPLEHKVSKYQNLYEMVKEVNSFYISQLEKSDVAKSYLAKRGLIELSEYANLGYAPKSGLLNFLRERKFNIEDAVSLGLLVKKDDSYFDFFRDRITFPIFNEYGSITGFGARSLYESGAKYINSLESKIFKKSFLLYGLFNKLEIKDKDYAIVTEGYTDVLALHKFGFKNAVASLGTSLTLGQIDKLKKITNNIVVLFDSDKAGLAAAERAIILMKSRDLNIKVCQLSYKDPDEFFKNRDLKSFIQELKKSKKDIDFLLSYYMKSSSSSKAILEKLKPFFDSITNRVDLEIYSEHISSKIKVSKNAILEYISNKQDNKVVTIKEESYLTKLEIETLHALDLDVKLLSVLKDSSSFNNSKISFLINVSNDTINQEIKEFISSLNLEDNIFSSLNSEELGELKEDILSAWKREDLKSIDSNNKLLISDYIKKKLEILD